MSLVSIRLRSQSGAALLVFLLLIVVSASTLLITKLNASIKHSPYNPQISLSLNEAKEALISWAVNHPFNPGTLPMPDRNGDGDYDGDGDCFNGGPIGNNLLLGRLPWRDYPGPCKDAASLFGLRIYPGITTDLDTDKFGRVLWYAVSVNLVYETSAYPFISPALVNKPTGWITLRDVNGNVISNRVAFVVLAPGPALSPYANCDALVYAGQDRSGAAPAAANYLDSVTIGGTTYSNSDADQDFIIYTNSNLTTGGSTLEKCDVFNDQLVYVTIDDLIDAVSKRVLNETTNFLSQYHNTYGVLPWLSPYADPKIITPVIKGEADVGATMTTLVDSAMDFILAGIAVGDQVHNYSDGSIGLVNSVGIPNKQTLTVTALVAGTNNDFGVNDEDYISSQSAAYPTLYLSGTSTSNSSGLILEDTTKDFVQLGVLPGDIVENTTDGSIGVIADVTTNTITVNTLTGGTENDFDDVEGYQINSHLGVATAGSVGNLLEDTTRDFISLGVIVGDLIRNVSDGSFGRVSAVPSATTLTVDKLDLGTDDDFDVTDAYIISRFNAVSGTADGHLAYHQQGEWFQTAFNIDWGLQQANGVTLLPHRDLMRRTALKCNRMSKHLRPLLV